jgi:hypothetical protein
MAVQLGGRVAQGTGLGWRICGGGRTGRRALRELFAHKSCRFADAKVVGLWGAVEAEIYKALDRA